MAIGRRIVVMSAFFFVCAGFAVYMFSQALTEGFISSLFWSEPATILFVGDVMLARDVEDKIALYGRDHFFDHVQNLHERALYTVVNFEASIPEVYTATPDHTFQFSVDPSLIPLLTNANVTHASLANNHADDYGLGARRHTKETLLAHGIVPIGVPKTVGSTSVETISVGDIRIALIAVEDILSPLNREDTLRLIRESNASHDHVIVYVHWGNEYELTHSTRQEELANAFVDAGADAIIGHHPHVVQDIGLQSGVPVFYSLGNYVFDQYWDDSVTQGLALLMQVEENTLTFELIPITIDRARPRLMSTDERIAFLESLARRSHESVRSAIVRGTVPY